MAAGCIIYIKQMDETEDEINHYRILRRIGFTNTDMIKGLAFKDYIQFRFTISGFYPCLFAANAFMMLIGNYTLTPIFIVMVIYSLVYLIFAVISFIHSERIIKDAI